MSGDYSGRLDKNADEFWGAVTLGGLWLVSLAVWLLFIWLQSTQVSPWTSDPFLNFLIGAVGILILVPTGLMLAAGAIVLWLISLPIIILVLLIQWLPGVSTAATVFLVALLAAALWKARHLLAESFFWMVDSPLGIALAPVVALFSVKREAVAGRETSEAVPEKTAATARAEDSMAKPTDQQSGPAPGEAYANAMQSQVDQLRERLGELVPRLPSEQAGWADWWTLVKQRILLNAEVRRNQPILAIVQQMDAMMGTMLSAKDKLDRFAVAKIDSERVVIEAQRKLAEEKALYAEVTERAAGTKAPKSRFDIANATVDEVAALLPPGDTRAELESTQDEFAHIKVVQLIEERLGADAFHDPLIRELLNRRGIPIDRLRPRRGE